MQSSTRLESLMGVLGGLGLKRVAYLISRHFRDFTVTIVRRHFRDFTRSEEGESRAEVGPETGGGAGAEAEAKATAQAAA